MLGKSVLLAVLAALTAVNAEGQYMGFNYGAHKANYQLKFHDDFLEEFKFAQQIANSNGKFSSARLYTMIQGNEGDEPIEAIEAAIKTKTTLLLGMWCSIKPEYDPVGHVKKEISALKKAIAKYGTDFTDLVVGLSIGSEDLYRSSPMGIKNKSDIGAEADDIIKYIKMVRDAIADTPLKSVPLGHVDTWTAWVDGSNKGVIEALDWIGFDGYPYFQSNLPNNSIEAAADLFWESYEATKQAVGGREVWITETGWPVDGKDMGLAKANTVDAQTYWNQIGCALFGNYKTWWYMLRDADPIAPEIEFGIVDAKFKPYYDLSCKNAKPIPSPLAVVSTSSAAPRTAAPSSTSAPSTRGPGSTFEVESSTRGSSGSPTNTAETAAKTTGADVPSSGFAVKATIGFVAAQVITAAFFLL
ncbi:hypothetical protein TWF506_004157 [Arthrobotrys conoides]|uniref:glucan endo-1,3-beta-D-glucosidase n=1 Tax=Arthrobotrys conoides TaxID=74498 RepID=A0AAN8N3Q3_9PEZI